MGRTDSIRSCAGCRQKGDRDVLLRLVLSGDPPELVPDVRRRAGGRGVSVHPTRTCLTKAVRTGALKRAFRRELSPDVDQLASWAGGQYGRRIDGLLSSAHRAGKAVAGSERVREAVRERQALLLVVASDARGDRDEIMRSAERLGGACLVHSDRQALGRLFGRESIAVAAVTDAGIAEELQVAARCVAELAEAS
ncbi:MAG: DUF448 domain-containing protein [Myxococcales bacterium]|nr:DUF448 domain-containing protein [Myxococcales bacterium]